MAGEAPLPLVEGGIYGKMRNQTFVQVTNESLNPNHHACAVIFTFLRFRFQRS